MSDIRSQARYLVEVTHRGDDESLVLELGRLTADRAKGGQQSYLIACELVSALASMMMTAAGPSGPEEASYGLELTDDEDHEIRIDEASPPVRAAVRALLAELNQHSEDTLFQLDLALREDTFQATLEVFAHVLLWTSGMLEWCDANDVPRPKWLGAMVSARRAKGEG
jgi:hypothetical protein